MNNGAKKIHLAMNHRIMLHNFVGALKAANPDYQIRGEAQFARQHANSAALPFFFNTSHVNAARKAHGMVAPKKQHTGAPDQEPAAAAPPAFQAAIQAAYDNAQATVAQLAPILALFKGATAP